MTEEEIVKINSKYFDKPEVEISDLVGVGEVKALHRPEKDSHKGQNGKLMVIGGSHLFHAASLWALKVASRIVDMVFYSSVPENNELVLKAKEEFRDGIVVPRKDIDLYIDEADAILIGPGLERTSETKNLSEKLFKKYSQKKWIIDAGSLQMSDVNLIPKHSIVTPHSKEFEDLFHVPANKENAFEMAKKYDLIVLLKGEKDIISDGKEIKFAVGGNPGMTKGGTGDVLAGLIAGFACKNEPFLVARAGAFLNKLAGDRLYKKAGTMFNASDLSEEIPGAFKWSLKF